MQVKQRYAVLSLLEAVLGGIIAAATLVVYAQGGKDLGVSSLATAIAGLGAFGLVYYLTVHQLLKKHHLGTSAITLSVISALNVTLVIMATGGLDSPYYALWLLAIVVAGLFGAVATGTVTGLTVLVYIYEFIAHRSQPGYTVGHLGQMGIIIGTALAAEWIHLALGRNSVQHTSRVEELSGQLDQAELKSNALMQSVGEGVLVVDAERRIQLFNPAATQMTGWNESSAQNIDYRLVLSLRDSAGNKIGDNDPFAEMWREGKSLTRNDLTIQTKGGHSVAVSLLISPIFNSEKQVSGGVALFRDISNEKEIERQRDEFISTASHEMRTPVAAIEGYLSLAMNPSVATIDARARGYLEKAHSSTQHLGELFRDLLTITKLEDAAKIDDQELFDMTKLVKDAVGDMQFTAQKKNLDLQFSTGDVVLTGHNVAPIYAVKGHQQRIREVLNNLMENAVKFTPQGSVHVAVSANAETVTVSVTDSGIGIAPEDIAHLFQKFYRIDTTATRTIGGTGLGLYLSRTIIELLGGRIWVESKLGSGSSFKFSLPRLDSTKLDAPRPVNGSSQAMPATAKAKTTLADLKQPVGVK